MNGDLDLAIADYDAALSLESEDPYALRFRGDAYFAKRDCVRAVADFNATLTIDDTDEVAYRGRATARLFNGEFHLAVADFNRVQPCERPRSRRPRAGPGSFGRCRRGGE